jgi:hypothetical protein
MKNKHVDAIYEAQSRGVGFKSVENWRKWYDYKFSAYEINVDEQAALDIMMKYSSMKYGKLDVLRYLFYFKTGIWIGINNEKRKFICSEIVMLVLEELGEYTRGESHKMTPEDVLQFCESKYKKA